MEQNKINTTPTICTIIAKNYIAFARVLSKSFLTNNPGGRCFVLIIDEIEGYIDPSHEVFEIIRIEELGLPRLKEFCFKYNITELSTAFKPYFLEFLLVNKNLDKLLYLDPDILITNNLGKLFGELESNDIILTPHLDTDYPDDGKMPNDGLIMMCGIYNLGFIGIRNCENTVAFLQWWKHKLYSKCIIDHAAGYFVDQKFIDLAVALFTSISIIRDTGYNVAYWNIHSRNIEFVNGTWMCNRSILYFYHFSNYKPEFPHEVSGHQNRFILSERNGLLELFNYYLLLLAENGYGTTKNWPYSYNYFDSGKIITNNHRRIYRTNIPRINVENPFSLSGLYLVWIRAIWITKKIIRLLANRSWRSPKPSF